MNLIIVRHADAGDASRWEGPDSERPLTDLGQKQARTLGAALRQRGIALDAVVSSPYLRTLQTASGLLEGMEAAGEPRSSELLAPGAMRRKQLAQELAALEASSVAIVGHDPDMPEFLGWLMDVDARQVFLKKGAAAFVQCKTEPEKGSGTLGWLLTPAWYMGS